MEWEIVAVTPSGMLMYADVIIWIFLASMGSVVKYLEESIPGVYVNSLMVGDNVVQVNII